MTKASGILLGILALLPWYKIYELAMYIAALMLLEGRMIGILMEGLLTIADGISQVFARSERFKGRNIWIGIDAGPIGLSDPASIAVGMLLIPLYVASAMIPGAKILPLADLAILPIFAMWAAAASGGNLIRTFINAFILSLLVIYITNSFAAPLTAAALVVDPTLIPAGLALVSSVDAGGHVMPWFIIMIFLGILAPGVVSWVDVVIAILVAVLWFASWWFAKDMPEMVAEELKKKLEGEE